MHLVEYFRYCLRENNDLVPLRAELRFVENYMEMQKTRFPGELAYTYLIEDGLGNALIPSLLIHNFVENAAKYARTGTDTVEVKLWIRREQDRLHMTIEDTGNGIMPEILDKLNQNQQYEDTNGQRHIGVWNCRRRLQTLFGDDTSLTIESTLGKGASVHIQMPLRMKEGAENA